MCISTHPLTFYKQMTHFPKLTLEKKSNVIIS